MESLLFVWTSPRNLSPPLSVSPPLRLLRVSKKTLQLFKPNSVTLQRCNSVTLQPNLQPSTFNFSIALPSFLCYPSPRSARHTPRGATTSSVFCITAKVVVIENVGNFQKGTTRCRAMRTSRVPFVFSFLALLRPSIRHGTGRAFCLSDGAS